MATQTLRPGPRRHIDLDEHLPVDHRLSKVYRVGAGLMGLVLLAFGILGLINKVGFFDTRGDTVAALNTNGTLSVLSICVGLILFAGMVIGGNTASTINMVFGILFILSGFLNLALLDTGYNFLAFRIQNVLFSFVVGLLLMVFGMYGRVGSALPHDNPYWKARNPELVEREQRLRAEATAAAKAGAITAAATTPKAQPKAVPGTEPAAEAGTKSAAEPTAKPAATAPQEDRRAVPPKPPES
ncbi:DUF4383 domain-containing protein [Streptomyces sp. NPDC048275]|uniref:DUF4383 domain-containing protein n=1 Tax=Streptomyces sp. NPDC048275 TaxID=3155629 RepID=UPI0033FA4344